MAARLGPVAPWTGAGEGRSAAKLHHDVDGLVAEVRQEVRFPVVLPPGGKRSSITCCKTQYSITSTTSSTGVPKVAQRAQRPLAFVKRAAPTVDDRHQRPAVIVGGEVRRWCSVRPGTIWENSW